MNQAEIFAGVRECVAATLSVDVTSIGEDDLLIGDLGADSLDLLDLSFHLQQKFQITISPRDLERRTQERLGGAPVEVEGVYTPEALAEFRREMTEIPPEELRDGLTVSELPRCFRVATMVRLVGGLLEEAHE